MAGAVGTTHGGRLLLCCCKRIGSAAALLRTAGPRLQPVGWRRLAGGSGDVCADPRVLTLPPVGQLLPPLRPRNR